MSCDNNTFRTRSLLLLLVLLMPTSGLLTGCFSMRSSDGGGQTKFKAPREVNPSDVALPAGYEIEVVATNLDFPTGVAFDNQGRIYVTEAGYSYGDVVTTPRLIRIEPDGSHTVIAEGTNPPWLGVEFHNGVFYVAGGHIDPGQILRITMDGKITRIVEGLPSLGDHHVNGPAISSDGWIYFGIGPATNSGVVGIDNFKKGWPYRYPKFHDIPCKDIVLTGINFTTPNPLTPDSDDKAVTGPYKPFGEPAEEGEVIQGQIPCSSSIMRVRPDGTKLQLVAWGLRNPFGLAFAPDGSLYVTENQYDVRGSRGIFGTGDLLWKIDPGTWYGFPDYYAGIPMEGKDWFQPPNGSEVHFLLKKHPGNPPEPVALLAVHSSSSGLDFSTNPAFGYEGQAFIAQFGDMAPGVGKAMAPVGFKVVRVDIETGVVYTFAANKGDVNGPASWQGSGGLERPISVRFNPEGTALYIVDFGVMTTSGKIRPKLDTGVIWRITRTSKKNE